MMHKQQLSQTIRAAGLSGKIVCAHSSLSSFGFVEGGAAGVVDAFLEEGCTLLVPTFWYKGYVRPPQGTWYAQNAMSPEEIPNLPESTLPYFEGENQISGTMGAIPKEVLSRPDRVRGAHPSNSFAAIGPMAREVILPQSPLNVYAPLSMSARLGGQAVLMGVGLTRFTAIHWAQSLAGKTLYRRWHTEENEQTGEHEVGSCSSGFDAFEGVVAPCERQIMAGQSLWRIFDLNEVIPKIAQAIRENPSLGHCGNPQCASCRDMAAGGPILSPSL